MSRWQQLTNYAERTLLALVWGFAIAVHLGGVGLCLWAIAHRHSFNWLATCCRCLNSPCCSPGGFLGLAQCQNGLWDFRCC
jgi:hypothetical protein